jgi:hypothetical protein
MTAYRYRAGRDGAIYPAFALLSLNLALVLRQQQENRGKCGSRKEDRTRNAAIELRANCAHNHSRKEHARHEDGLTITTNTVEGHFAILQRGINGICHQVGKQYLDQYLREFDFRYNGRKLNDVERTLLAIKQASGKRLLLNEPKAGSTSKPN